MPLLVNKKGIAGGAVFLAAAAAAILLLLLLSAAPPPRAAASRRQHYRHPVVPFETYLVILRAPPNADAMDGDAHRRWHESFLPSTVVADYYGDEPRLLDSYYRYVRYGIYAFAARLTLTEMESYVSKKPGVLGSRRCPPKGLTLDCMTCEAGVLVFDCGALPLLLSKPDAPASQIDLIAQRSISM